MSVLYLRAPFLRNASSAYFLFASNTKVWLPDSQRDTSIPKSLDVRYLTCSMDSKDFYIDLLNSIREAENFGFTMNSL